MSKLGEGSELDPELARIARRCIPSLNNLLQDRPDFYLATCALSQHMSCPTEDREVGVKRVIYQCSTFRPNIAQCCGETERSAVTKALSGGSAW